MTTPSITTIEQLSISNPSFQNDPTDPTEHPMNEDILPPMPFDRQARPQSSRSIRSTTSRSSVNNADGRVLCQDYHANKFFSYQNQGFEKAVLTILKGFFPNVEQTEEYRHKVLKRAWLLIDIDHWDFHREVIAILMDNHILIVRYNFIKEKIIYSQTILYEDIRSITFGLCCYPDRSMMGEYSFGGVRIVHGDEPSFLTRWNPAAQTNQHTLVSHYLTYNDKERETSFYNCDEFIQMLEITLNDFRRAKNQAKLEFTEDKIVIPSYANLLSVIYNQNFLGFNRDRNGAKW